MRMLKPIFAALALLTSGAAYSADLAKPAAPEPAKVVELVSPFQGLYIGAILGHTAGSINDAEGFKIPREGYTATAVLGYNHRAMHGVVVGLEGDFGLTDVSGATNAGGGFTVRGSNKFNSSLRARLGFVPLGHTMLYATGGVALTNAKLSVDDIGSQEKNTKGWVVGAGIESMLFGNAGVRVEALRTQWLDQAYTIGGADTGKLGSHDTVVRAGLVFRLN